MRGMILLAAVMAAGCDRSGYGPPKAYEPLPMIASLPTVLVDTEELRDYINAFPISSYERHEVPDAGHFFIDDAEDVIKQVIVAGRQWEAHTIELCERHIKPGTVVLEVGAHIGSHTVPISRLVGPWGRVYAFEPQRKIYRELHHNLALNGVTNVVPLRYAIGSGEARVIEMNPPTPGNEGGTGVGASGDRAELRSLDSFRFERVSVLKIDVEGHENEVLAGASETIRQNRPVILIEIAGGHWYETAPPEILDQIHGTWKKIEAFDYTVTHVGANAYIGLPNETSQDSSILREIRPAGQGDKPDPARQGIGVRTPWPRDGKPPSPR